jgi:TRAP-type uncharacterized transport system fused permease subunit
MGRGRTSAAHKWLPLAPLLLLLLLLAARCLPVANAATFTVTSVNGALNNNLP